MANLTQWRKRGWPVPDSNSSGLARIYVDAKIEWKGQKSGDEKEKFMVFDLPAGTLRTIRDL